MAENPEEMWEWVERLERIRIAQRIPIEEVVQEYRILVDVVRDWIEERAIDVPFWNIPTSTAPSLNSQPSPSGATALNRRRLCFGPFNPDRRVGLLLV